MANWNWQPIMLPARHGQLFAGLPIQPQVTDSEEDRESEVGDRIEPKKLLNSCRKMATPSRKSMRTLTSQMSCWFRPDWTLFTRLWPSKHPRFEQRNAPPKSTMQENIQMPTKWNPEDKARHLSLSQDGLRITHKSRSKERA